MTSLRRLLCLLAVFALAGAIGCGKSEPSTKSGPPEGYQGSKGGPPGGVSTNTPAKP